MDRDPEGVYAVVWHHGEPIGEIVVPGVPDLLAEALPGLAAATLADEIAEHQLRDALTAREGLRLVADRGLAAVEHPGRPITDARDVTVAVCTRDRPDDLRRCLAAIGALTSAVAEVLVVDNASADSSTRDVAGEFPFVRYVWEPRQGLDFARNRALLEASTPYVAFTDDDVIVHPRWVDGLLRAFQEEPSAVVVTGLVVPAELATPAPLVFEAEGGFGRGFRRQYFAAAIGNGEVAARRYAGIGRAGTGANMAVRRAPVLELGGFDPALDVGTPTGGGGDLELYFRVIAAGHALVYEPTAVVRHRHRQTMEGLARQRRGDGTAFASWFLGAGRRYGPVQFAHFLRATTRWLWLHHTRHLVLSLLAPEVRSPVTIRADARGAVDAVAGRYYRRARRHAAAQLAAHPDLPVPPPLRHTPARLRRSTTSPAAVSVDLSRNGLWADCDERIEGRDAPTVTVHVARPAEGSLRFEVETGGVGLSAARLRRELAARLGPQDLGPHLAGG